MTEADVGELKTKLRVARECLQSIRCYLSVNADEDIVEDIDLTIRYMNGDNV